MKLWSSFPYSAIVTLPAHIIRCTALRSSWRGHIVTTQGTYPRGQVTPITRARVLVQD